METEHEWELLRGSNLTYKCQKCGVLGHPEDKTKTSNIIPNIQSPYRNNCKLGILNAVHAM